MNMMVSAAAMTAAMPVHAQVADAELLEMREEILRQNEIAHQWDDEIRRTQEAWVKGIPAAQEQTRLCELQDPHYSIADDLMQRVWPIRAQTPEGKRAKIAVLFGHVLGANWRGTDEDIDLDIRCVRHLLFELGGVQYEDVIEAAA